MSSVSFYFTLCLGDRPLPSPRPLELPEPTDTRLTVRLLGSWRPWLDVGRGCVLPGATCVPLKRLCPAAGPSVSDRGVRRRWTLFLGSVCFHLGRADRVPSAGPPALGIAHSTSTASTGQVAAASAVLP